MITIAQISCLECRMSFPIIYDFDDEEFGTYVHCKNCLVLIRLRGQEWFDYLEMEVF